MVTSVTAKAHVLVVDDDQSMLSLVTRWLEAAGYSVTALNDGRHVAGAVQQALPAAIVMDLSMPNVDGFQALDSLRKVGLSDLPVLMLTGRQSAEDVRKAVTLGAKDYLAKPVERDQLLTRLERMLHRYGAKHEPAKAIAQDGPAEEHYLD